MHLFRDLYFWFGITLFVASVLGIVWILKALQKEPEAELLFPPPADLEPLAFSPPAPASAPKAAPIVSIVPKVSPDSAITSLPSAAPKANLDSLSQQLGKIEQAMSEIARGLDRQSKAEKSEVSEELKELIQLLKSRPNPGGADNDQITKLSSKIDKLYQAITALSSADEK